MKWDRGNYVKVKCRTTVCTYLVLILCVCLNGKFGEGKIFQQCELARLLKNNYGMALDDVAHWVCIAEHSSSLDSSKFGGNARSGSHGLFQISDQFWCSQPEKPNSCGISCDRLRDDDIRDDVECAQVIYEEHRKLSGDGYDAWNAYTTFCKGNPYDYIVDCFGRHEEKYLRSKIIAYNSIEDEEEDYSPRRGKIYEKCELARELANKHNVPMEQISTWVCIANHESRFDTSAVGRLNADGSADHGLFQISDLYWCSHKGGRRKACGLSCNKLLDSDITDDVKCVQQIYNEHDKISGDGFSAWTVYSAYCSGDTESYIRGCFDDYDNYFETAESHSAPFLQYQLIHGQSKQQQGINPFFGKSSYESFDRSESKRNNYAQNNQNYGFVPKNKPKGKIYDECELANELENVHHIPHSQIAMWVCIAKHQSQLDTSSSVKNAHGLFHISDEFWCSPPGAGKECEVACSDLEDSDITDDVQCIQRIYNEHHTLYNDGFHAWNAYSQYCSGGRANSYVGHCQGFEASPVDTNSYALRQFSQKTGKPYDHKFGGNPFLKYFEVKNPNALESTFSKPSASIFANSQELSQTYENPFLRQQTRPYVPATTRKVSTTRSKSFPQFSNDFGSYQPQNEERGKVSAFKAFATSSLPQFDNTPQINRLQTYRINIPLFSNQTGSQLQRGSIAQKNAFSLSTVTPNINRLKTYQTISRPTPYATKQPTLTTAATFRPLVSSTSNPFYSSQNQFRQSISPKPYSSSIAPTATTFQGANRKFTFGQTIRPTVVSRVQPSIKSSYTLAPRIQTGFPGNNGLYTSRVTPSLQILSTQGFTKSPFRSSTIKNSIQPSQPNRGRPQPTTGFISNTRGYNSGKYDDKYFNTGSYNTPKNQVNAIQFSTPRPFFNTNTKSVITTRRPITSFQFNNQNSPFSGRGTVKFGTTPSPVNSFANKGIYRPQFDNRGFPIIAGGHNAKSGLISKRDTDAALSKTHDTTEATADLDSSISTDVEVKAPTSVEAPLKISIDLTTLPTTTISEDTTSEGLKKTPEIVIVTTPPNDHMNSDSTLKPNVVPTPTGSVNKPTNSSTAEAVKKSVTIAPVGEKSTTDETTDDHHEYAVPESQNIEITDKSKSKEDHKKENVPTTEKAFSIQSETTSVAPKPLSSSSTIQSSSTQPKPTASTKTIEEKDDGIESAAVIHHEDSQSPRYRRPNTKSLSIITPVSTQQRSSSDTSIGTTIRATTRWPVTKPSTTIAAVSSRETLYSDITVGTTTRVRTRRPVTEPSTIITHVSNGQTSYSDITAGSTTPTTTRSPVHRRGHLRASPKPLPPQQSSQFPSTTRAPHRRGSIRATTKSSLRETETSELASNSTTPQRTSISLRAPHLRTSGNFTYIRTTGIRRGLSKTTLLPIPTAGPRRSGRHRVSSDRSVQTSTSRPDSVTHDVKSESTTDASIKSSVFTSTIRPIIQRRENQLINTSRLNTLATPSPSATISGHQPYEQSTEIGRTTKSTSSTDITSSTTSSSSNKNEEPGNAKDFQRTPVSNNPNTSMRSHQISPTRSNGQYRQTHHEFSTTPAPATIRQTKPRLVQSITRLSTPSSTPRLTISTSSTTTKMPYMRPPGSLFRLNMTELYHKLFGAHPPKAFN